MEEKSLSVLNDVTERVRYYARRSAGDMLELGKALTEAKELVPHGEWEGYVRDNAGMELRMAQNFMQAYRKWGTGNPDLSRLNVGQMIALLPASDDEMEKISGERDLSEMSSREIKAAIQKARREGRAEAEEEQAEKTRDAMQCMANDKARELAKQKIAFDEELKKKIDETRAEQAEQIEALKAQLIESREAANALREQAEQAESAAQDATRAAIEAGRDVSAQSAKLEAEARRLHQELADKDAIIEELQAQYDEVNRNYLDAQSAIAKGDAERKNADILSAEAVSDAVRIFIGQVGRIPYMHSTFAMMENAELEEYRANVLQVMEWADKSLRAMATVSGGGIVE